MTAAAVAGVDGAPGGWVVVRALAASPVRVLDVGVVAGIGEVVDDVAAGRLAVACIDMPAGLPDRGRRACEATVRAQLGPRRSSVFWTPPRPVLDHRDDPVAADLRCRELSGSGLSRQAFHLLPKVAQLDAALRAAGPTVAARVWEAHPELAFTRLLGHPALHAKRGAAGAVERFLALAGAGIDAAPWLRDPPAGDGGDVLDALALADTAARLARGEPVLGVDDGTVDRHGLPVRIVG